MRALLFALLLSLAITPVHRPGFWCDVTPHAFVRADGAKLIVEDYAGNERWSWTVNEPLMEVRATENESNDVFAIAKGNASGTAYTFAQSGVHRLDATFGGNAVAVGYTRAAGVTYFAQVSPTTYHAWNQTCVPCTVAMPATSQGFRDVQPDGTVRRADDYYTRSFNGRQLWQYAQRGDVTVGQGGPPAGIYAAVNGTTFQVVPGDGFDPHVALLDNGFAVAARTSAGATLAVVTPPYPAPVPPVPVPPQPPVVKQAGVVVNAFTLTPKANLPDNVVFDITDPYNPQLGTRVRGWVENGSMVFSIDYPAAGPNLAGRTYARRPVR